MSEPLFSTATTNPFGLADVGAYVSPTFADIDGDGDLDAFVGAVDGTIKFFRNIGRASIPKFSAETDNFGLAYVGTVASPTFADIDGDGDLDAFVGNSNGNTLFFRNTGSAKAPQFAAETVNFGLTDIGTYAHPAFADIDGDGDLDAFVSGVGISGFTYTFLFRNTGNASAPQFVRATDGDSLGLDRFGTIASVAFADIDSDGDLDAFVGNSNGNTFLFRNIGSDKIPYFSLTTSFGLTDVGAYAAPTLADIDGDGDLDVLVGNSNGDLIYFANRAADIVIAESGGRTGVIEGGANDSFTVVLKHKPSANVVINLDNTNGQITTNVSKLTFTPANWNVVQTVTVKAVNDSSGEGGHQGVLQFHVASTDSIYAGIVIVPLQITVVDNDLPVGDPIFTSASTNPFGLANIGYGSIPTLGDIDSDGDLDVLIGLSDGPIRFFRNTGNATLPQFSFETANFGLPPAIGYFASPTLVDIDADGDLDVFVPASNQGYSMHFFRNIGNASTPKFSAITDNIGLDNGLIAHITFADIDNDGDLDAFTSDVGGHIVFYRNYGSVTSPQFDSETTDFFNADLLAVPALANIDGDGDLDAFVGTVGGKTVFFRNTGNTYTPNFSLESNNFGIPSIGKENTVAPAIADLDGDGDLDALIGSGSGNLTYFANNSHTPTLGKPAALAYSDTKFDDVFQTKTGTLKGSDGDGDTLTYGIVGGTDYNGNGNVSRITAYGTLTVNTTTGGYDFKPKDAAIAALIADLTINFTVFVTDNAHVNVNQILAITISQSGITESNGNDNLVGTAANEKFNALNGNDTINGGGGTDTMVGGLGNDIYVVDNVGDKVIETSNLATEIDKVISFVSQVLSANVENLELMGTTAINGTGNNLANTIVGNTSANILNGGVGADRMVGGLGNDWYVVDNAGDKVFETSALATERDKVFSSVSYALGVNVENLVLKGTTAINGTGNNLANIIIGNAAANILNGGLGNDTLTGSLGNDIFRLTTLSNDRITDFNVAADTIQLENGVFTKLTVTGVLSANHFKIGAATDADDYVLYNSATGSLVFDSNGNGAGGATQIALLSVGLTLTNTDFVVI